MTVWGLERATGVNRPSTNIGGLTSTWATEFPKGSDRFALVCVPETISDTSGTRLYLIERVGRGVLVADTVDIAGQRYHSFLYLPDGSLLMVGGSRIRRVSRSGNAISLASSIEFTPPEGDYSEWNTFAPIDRSSFYRIIGFDYSSSIGVAGYSRAYARRYRYDINTDSLVTEVGWHEIFRVGDFPVKDTSYRWDTPYAGIGADFGDGFVGVPWRYNWYDYPSAHAELSINVFQVNVDLTLTMAPGGFNNSTGISSGSSTFHESGITTRYEGNFGVGVSHRRTTSSIHTSRFATWRYTLSGGFQTQTVTRTPNYSDSTPNRAAGMGTAFYPGQVAFMYYDGGNQIAIAQYDRDSETEGKEPVDTYLTGKGVIDPSSSWEDPSHAALQSYTCCRMGPHATLVTFEDNSDDPQLRYFRLIHDNTFEEQGVGLFIPKKRFPVETTSWGLEGILSQGDLR